MLRSHAARRAEDRSRTLAFSDGLAKLTSNDAPLLRPLRSAGLLAGDAMGWLQGWLADLTSIHFSFIVGVACFAYLAFYALRAPVILRKQGIDLDQLASGSGH